MRAKTWALAITQSVLLSATVHATESNTQWSIPSLVLAVMATPSQAQSCHLVWCN